MKRKVYFSGYAASRYKYWHEFVEVIAYVAITLGILFSITLVGLGAWLAYIWA